MGPGDHRKEAVAEARAALVGKALLHRLAFAGFKKFEASGAFRPCGDS
jgi:hypothetical protein